MERPKFRSVSALAAAGFLLASCATSDTTEGIRTQGCVPGTFEFSMEQGDKIYLGDISSDDTYFDGPKADWAFIEHNLGQLVASNENRDEGSFEIAEEGLTYSENDIKYDISIGERTAGQDTLQVTVQTDCGKQEKE